MRRYLENISWDLKKEWEMQRLKHSGKFDTSLSKSEIPWTFCNVVLDKDGENQPGQITREMKKILDNGKVGRKATSCIQ
jgi:hypothetical protein